MRYLWPGILVLIVAGCNPSYTDTSRDPEAYAKNVKQLVISQVESARKSSDPADEISVIVSELDGSISRPIGSYGDTYNKILTESRDLLAECERAKGRPANLGKRLDDIKKIAETLPGDVQLQKAGD